MHRCGVSLVLLFGRDVLLAWLRKNVLDWYEYSRGALRFLASLQLQSQRRSNDKNGHI